MNAFAASLHQKSITGFEQLEPFEIAVLDDWQRDFPLTPRPYSTIAERHECRESDVLAAYQSLADQKVLSRIGAILAPNSLGASLLAAMSVQNDQVDSIAASISGFSGVNHNYERENAMNLWFVATARDKETLEGILCDIENETGYQVHRFYMERAYHLDLGFALRGRSLSNKVVRDDQPDLAIIRPEDRDLMDALEDGLPLIGRPYMAIADQLGWTEARVLSRLEDLQAANIIRRFGCVVHHRRVGYKANAMVVWDLPDEKVDDIASRLARDPGVTLCYRRNREAGVWSFNLYCMVHAHNRADAEVVIRRLNSIVGDEAREHNVLFSNRCFKQRGAQLVKTRRGIDPRHIAAQ